VDDIAWLFNLRGSDVSYNPVFLAHALIDAATSATLFVANGKVPADSGCALEGGRRHGARLPAGWPRLGRAANGRRAAA
jgi:hypothetical protein